jgi:hypothetical protein
MLASLHFIGFDPPALERAVADTLHGPPGV